MIRKDEKMITNLNPSILSAVESISKTDGDAISFSSVPQSDTFKMNKIF